MPLAERIRPKILEDLVGQEHLFKQDGPLFKMIELKRLQSVVFFGPSGTGKTTAARLIASMLGRMFYSFDATNCSVKTLRDAALGGENCSGAVVYIDEIQYFNKKQQQSLLPYVESGEIVLIASTTENPSFYVYGALLSRCLIFEFRPVSSNEVAKVLNRAVEQMEKELNVNLVLEEEAAKFISEGCGGDVRKAVNFLEICCILAKNSRISLDLVKKIPVKFGSRYDLSGSEHYNILSAFQKSIRGSDENAALHYLARFLEAGDLVSPCRRLLVIASEDVGLAFPGAVSIVKSCVDSALQLGLPEARIPLAQAVILLATAPKSNSVYVAINKAVKDVKSGKIGDIPDFLKSSNLESNVKKYKYPHDFLGHYVSQQYMPNILKEEVYYEFGDNKLEQAALKYRKKILNLEE